MKHVFIHHVMAIMMIIAILITSTPLVYSKNAGAIWTTREDCGEEQQDVNHYETGEMVTINGANFEPNTTYTWTITGQPGGASADPDIIVATGTVTTDFSGAFCIAAYIVAADDDGEYTVDIPEAKKNDNYRVRGVDITPTEQPTPTTQPTPTGEPSPTTQPTIETTPSVEPEPTQIPVLTGQPTEVPQEPTPTVNPSPTGVPSANQQPAPTGTKESDTVSPTTKPGPQATTTPQRNSSSSSDSGVHQNGGTGAVKGITSFPETGSSQTTADSMVFTSDTTATQTRLTIPKLELAKPLYFATVMNNEYQVRDQDISDALYDGTRMLYGHNTDQVFGKLQRLTPGDEVYLQRTGVSQKYLVSRIDILPETEIEKISGRGTDTLVLTTCLPSDESKRIVIYAERSAY